MSRTITFVTGNAGKLAEMASSETLELKSVKCYTPKKLSPFSGSKTSAAYLPTSVAKERRDSDMKMRDVDNIVPTPMTVGQQLTHSILSGARQGSRLCNGKRSDISGRLQASERPIADPSRTRTMSSLPLQLSSRKKQYCPAARVYSSRERKVRYANAISAWDRAKRQMAEQTSYPTREGTISVILRGAQPKSDEGSKPPKWSDRHRMETFPRVSDYIASSLPRTNRSLLQHGGWVSSSFSEDEFLGTNTLNASTRDEEAQTSFGSWGSCDINSSGSSGCGSVINDLLKEWFA